MCEKSLYRLHCFFCLLVRFYVKVVSQDYLELVMNKITLKFRGIVMATIASEVETQICDIYRKLAEIHASDHECEEMLFQAEGAAVELARQGDQDSHTKQLTIIDTETHVKVGSIRRYLSEDFNLSNVLLLYNGQTLRRDSLTLRDYGWVDGTFGTIIVVDQTSSEAQ